MDDVNFIIYVVTCSLSLFFLAAATRYHGTGSRARHQPRVGFARQPVSLFLKLVLKICRERAQENKKLEKLACDQFAKDSPNGLGVRQV